MTTERAWELNEHSRRRKRLNTAIEAANLLERIEYLCAPNAMGEIRDALLELEVADRHIAELERRIDTIYTQMAGIKVGASVFDKLDEMLNEVLPFWRSIIKADPTYIPPDPINAVSDKPIEEN